MTATTKLTEHFTLRELTTTQRAFANHPGPHEIAELERLCRVVLEPFRELVGPLRVNSGYRSRSVNKAVGGHPQSAHLDGRAADVVPFKTTCRDAMRALEASGIPFDRAIYERRSGLPWIHIQVRELPRPPRRQLLMSLEPGRFDAWDPTDPRIT